MTGSNQSLQHANAVGASQSNGTSRRDRRGESELLQVVAGDVQAGPAISGTWKWMLVFSCFAGLFFLMAVGFGIYAYLQVPKFDSSGLLRPTWMSEVGSALQGTTGALGLISGAFSLVASSLFQRIQMIKHDYEVAVAAARNERALFSQRFLERLDRLERRRELLRVDDAPHGAMLFPALVRRLQDDLAAEADPSRQVARELVGRWDEDLRAYYALFLSMTDLLRTGMRAGVFADPKYDDEVFRAAKLAASVLSPHEWTIVLCRRFEPMNESSNGVGSAEDDLGKRLAGGVEALPWSDISAAPCGGYSVYEEAETGPVTSRDQS
jgi:hypothetical protein